MINDVDPTHKNFWIRPCFHYFKVNIFHYAFMIIMLSLYFGNKIYKFWEMLTGALMTLIKDIKKEII